MMFALLPFIAMLGTVTNASPTPKGATGLKYKNLLMFGDSYSDNCNTYRALQATPAEQALYKFPNCPAAPIGRADGGRQWPELLPSIVPGISVTNVAYSGATCNNALFDRSPILDVGQQISFYRANATALDPSETLVGIYIGTNDLTFLVNTQLGTLPTPSFNAPNISVVDEANCVLGRIKQLYEEGFKNQLIFQNIPLQATVLFSNTTATQNGTQSADLVETLAKANNAIQAAGIQLFNQAHDDANIQICPTYNLYANIIASPEAYLGAGAVSGPTCDMDPSYNASSVNVCQKYVFANNLHPSQATGYILAQQVAKYLQGGKSNFEVVPY